MDRKTAEIRKIVKDICDKGGQMQWEMHIMPVMSNAMKLAGMLNADKKIVEISVYLHDIARLREKREDHHHIKGAKMAEEILTKLGYEKTFIKKVSYCIICHRGPSRNCKTREAKILNSADAMSHFDNVPYLFWIATACKGMGFKEALEWVDYKMEKGWNEKMQPEAKKLYKPKYEAAKLLLDSSRGYLYGRKN